MTDRSMFPDLAPDKTDVRRTPALCCEGLTPPPNVPSRVWNFVHAMGHSRVPFTVEGLASVAESTDHQARVCIRNAGQRGWIDPVLPERYETDPTPKWVGVLPRRR